MQAQAGNMLAFHLAPDRMHQGAARTMRELLHNWAGLVSVQMRLEAGECGLCGGSDRKPCLQVVVVDLAVEGRAGGGCRGGVCGGRARVARDHQVPQVRWQSLEQHRRIHLQHSNQLSTTRL